VYTTPGSRIDALSPAPATDDGGSRTKPAWTVPSGVNISGMLMYETDWEEFADSNVKNHEKTVFGESEDPWSTIRSEGPYFGTPLASKAEKPCSIEIRGTGIDCTVTDWLVETCARFGFETVTENI